MATVAEELLNDFGDLGDESEGDEQQDFKNGFDGKEDETSADAVEGVRRQMAEEDGIEGEEDGLVGPTSKGKDQEAEDEEATKARIEKMQLSGVNDVRSVAGLMRVLEPVLEKIAHYENLPSSQQNGDIGSVEDNPEYKLLTQSNTLSTQIDGEIILVHKFIRDHYSVRFPELETLISNPLDYAQTVATIGNGPMNDIKNLRVNPTVGESLDQILDGPSLDQILDGPSLMVVSVEATQTKGREMSEKELSTILRACKMTMDLAGAKHKLTDYVQSRMNVFAPNLTALIGSLTAAQLLNYAGGLAGLAKTPACNIAPLGSKKQSIAGLATNVGYRHQGFLYQSPLIKGIPNDLKKQAMRIVSAKVIIAARMDSVHSSPDGEFGQDLKQQCLTRLDKLMEPPPNTGVRALPAPDDKPSRKRGGRRARKAKEAIAVTELHKQANRMAFGKEEQEVGYGDTTRGLGMIGQSGGGLRAIPIDQKTKAKLSKKNPGWGIATGTGTAVGKGTGTNLRGHGLRTSGVGGAALGTASTVAFSATQGLELVDPKVKEQMLEKKRKADADRYFKTGTFTQVNAGGMTDDGFKIPGKPAKRVDTGATK